MRKSSQVLAGLLVAGACALPAVATAESPKTCPTNGPGKAAFTQEQKAQCESGGTKNTTTGVSNPGGNQPPSKQP
jgi:hypothetical protein